MKGNKILIRVGGGFIGIEEFIQKFTPQEYENIRKRDPLARFQQKKTVQNIAIKNSIASRESSPIRQPQGPGFRDQNKSMSPVRTGPFQSPEDFNSSKQDKISRAMDDVWN